MRFARYARRMGGLIPVALLVGCVLVHEDREVPTRAAGTFDVQLTPRHTDTHPAGVELGRSSLTKRFRGDLEGVAEGEMLTVLSPVDGSAGYVAIEHVAGILHGRRGTFVLQHNGIMTRGAPQLVVSVVPDSGTGELTGLAGTMRISPAAEGHAYEFEYTIEERNGR